MRKGKSLYELCRLRIRVHGGRRGATSTERAQADIVCSRFKAGDDNEAGTTASKPTPVTKPTQPASGTKSAKSTQPSAASGLSNFFTQIGKATPYIQQGMDFAKLGMQVGQQFSGPPSGGQQPQPPDPATPPPPAAPLQSTGAGDDPSSGMPATMPQGMPAGAAGMDQFAALLQALRQQQLASQPAPAPPAPQPSPYGPPQSDPLALLRMIISNPQLQQALQQRTMGPAAPRAISLPMPAKGRQHGRRQMTIPLGAVMNAIYSLAGQSMEQLNANTREDDPEVPEYLVGEDGEFLVDPANPRERAELVERLFEISEAARSRPALRRRRRSIESEGDESERWALEAGFTR